MSKKYRLKSYDNLMISSYKKISDGIFINENFEPYKKEFFLEILKYLESQEMYEECEVLNNIINKRFDHELNYKNLQYEQLR
jgi:hypothetical protein